MSHPANEELADQCTDKAIDELRRLGITPESIKLWSTYFSDLDSTDHGPEYDTYEKCHQKALADPKCQDSFMIDYDRLINLVAMYYYEYYMERDVWTN